MPTHPGAHERPRRWGPGSITLTGLLRGRFTGLTIVLLVLSFSANVIGPKDIRELVIGLAFSVLLLFAVWSVRRRLRVATLALALPTLIGHWTFVLSNSPLLRAVGFALTSGFLTFLTLVILLAVFQDATVTADTIVGAVCAYFMLGVTWGTYYALLELVSPAAFSVSEALTRVNGGGAPGLPITPLMQYYSFTTLATLGYGDISPVTAMARGLSVMEGIGGQLYLAVLIARLVGMHTAKLGKE